jgi:hypothetical protein
MSATTSRLGRAGEVARDLLIGGGQVLVASVGAPLLRRYYNRYGATEVELQRSLPGDELVPHPKLGYTRAITIDAGIDHVWAWLVQYGRGRAGFYSYDALENLLSCGIHSVDEILPEHQQLEVGDLIRSGRDNQPCWQVVEVAPPRHLVLIGAGTPAHPEAPAVVARDVPTRGYVASTWQWFLDPLDAGRRTRLLVRQRLTYSPNQAVLWHVVEPLNFVMERRMLLGIRDRAERQGNLPAVR